MDDLLNDEDFLRWEQEQVGDLIKYHRHILGEKTILFRAARGPQNSDPERYHGRCMFDFKSTHSEPYECEGETHYLWDAPMTQMFDADDPPEDAVL